MPVNSISYQPAVAQLMAAYRPIVLKVLATETGGDPTPPYVVCDIYIDDVYYKSIFRTTAETDGSWFFDISTALQEYLQPDLGQLDNELVLASVHSSAKVFCRFRSSGLDDNGFTEEEGTRPVQATRTTDAVAGDGFQSNAFFVINAALQHEDNQNLETHLNSYKNGDWSDDAYPLSHRSKYFFCPGDGDHFPVVFKGDCTQTALVMHFRLRGETEFQEVDAEDINTCDAIEFEVSTEANRVTVVLGEELPEGQSVLVQYKKQDSGTWISAGNYTEQSFGFNINGDDIGGDYDIRVVRFCTPCFSSDPAIDEFTLDGTSQDLGWRGINPVCSLTGPAGTIYAVLETRNPAVNTTYIPDNINPTTIRTEDVADLWVKFYSDAAHLIPLSVTQANLKVFVKQRTDTDRDAHPNDYVYEQMNTYTVSPSAQNEIMLAAAVRTNYREDYYVTYPSLDGFIESVYTYTPFPTDRIPLSNNGMVFYEELQEYNTTTLIPTGNVKPNLEADPDYIAPSENTDACPLGPPKTVIVYSTLLDVMKVDVVFGGVHHYAETAETEDQAATFIMSVPKYTDITISVKAATTDSGNLTGIIKCRVTYYNGTSHVTAEFNIPDNVETTLPQTFQNVSTIALNNV
jgi:hypothetical protein